jgi:hypothetical protein
MALFQEVCRYVHPMDEPESRRAGAPDVRRVKLMADYYAFPLWAVASEGLGAEWSGMLAPDALPLSAALIERLQAWADEHDQLLDTDYEWPSEDARIAWIDRGRPLAAQLRAELGPAYVVTYFEHEGDR